MTKKVFERYDLNSDSYIDRKELQNMLNLGLEQLQFTPLNKLDMDALIEKFDADFDDKLNLK